MQQSKVSCCLLLVLLFFAGCGGKNNLESFLREDVDLAFVTRVAVVPFENNSKEQFAAERVRGMAITQILAQGLFDVVDKGLVDSALREEAVDLAKAPMDAGVMKRLGQRLNVQAFLFGTIDQAGDIQRGNNSYSALSVTLRLVDVNTGMIFWQASGSRTGDSMSKRLFGLGSDDEFRIAINLLRQLLTTVSSDRRVKLPTAAAAPQAVAPAEAVRHLEPESGGAEQGGGTTESGELSSSPEAVDEQASSLGQDEPLTLEKIPQPEAEERQDTISEPGPPVPETASELPPATAVEPSIESGQETPPPATAVAPPTKPELERPPAEPPASLRKPTPPPAAPPTPAAPAETPAAPPSEQEWPE